MLVYVNDKERERIKSAARAAGLSVSSYLRAVGTGYRPSDVQDVAAVARLADINKAVGQIGRALAGRVEAGIIAEIEAVQVKLAEAVRQAGPG